MVPFISIADLSVAVGQDLMDSDLAVIAIDSACEAVRSYIGQDVNYQDDDEIAMDGAGTGTLLLPQMPVWDVSEVVTTDEFGTEETLVDFTFEQNGILRVGLGIFPLGRANVVVKYSHGWDVVETQQDPDIPRVPADLRLVALRAANRIFTTPEVAGTAAALRDDIGGTAAWTPFLAPEILTPEDKAILDAGYRQVEFA